MCLVYASQTGTAEEFSERIKKELEFRYDFKVLLVDPEHEDLACLDELKDDQLAVFLVATQGEGEPTDNIVEFYEAFVSEEEFEFSQGGSLQDEDLPLKNLNYLVFGLGNSTYEHFNACAIEINNAFKRYGGKEVVEIVLGDDDKGLELYFDKWKDSLYDLLKEKYSLKETAKTGKARKVDYSIIETEEEDTEDSLTIHSEYELPIKTGSNVEIMGRSKNNPCFSRIAKCYNLCQAGDNRVCLHMEFDIDSGLSKLYESGDHLSIWPINPVCEVNKILGLFNLQEKKDTKINIKPTSNARSGMSTKYSSNKTTYYSLFAYCLDIVRPPSKPFLEELKDMAKLDSIKNYLTELLSDYALVTNFKTTGDILVHIKHLIQNSAGIGNQVFFPNEFLDINIEALVDNYKRIIPRYYSISSSSLMYPTKIHVTAIVLNYESYSNQKNSTSNGNLVYGLCTNYFLAVHNHLNSTAKITAKTTEYNIAKAIEDFNFKNELKAPIYVRKSGFKLPKDTTIPLIMIGPGTGIAPLRAFVQEKLFIKETQNREIGEINLYFGCRNENEHIYKLEMIDNFESLNKNGKATHSYKFAYSREKKYPKTYVQDLLIKDIKHLNDLICNQNAYVYVCGDGRNMAKEVNETIVKIIAYGTENLDSAAKLMKTMKSEMRYLEDVWY